MMAGSFEVHLQLDLLSVNCNLAELTHRSNQFVNVDDFTEQRNFTFVNPSKVEQIVNQSRFQLQIAVDNQQVGTDFFWQFGITLDSGKNSKDWRERGA